MLWFPNSGNTQALPPRCYMRKFLCVKAWPALPVAGTDVFLRTPDAVVLSCENIQCLLGADVFLSPLEDSLSTQTGAQLNKTSVVTVFEVTKEGVAQVFS